MKPLFQLNILRRLKYVFYGLVIVYLLIPFLTFLFEDERSFLSIINEGVSHPRYLIDTPGCKIPYFEPSPLPLQNYFVGPKKPLCSNSPSLEVTSSKQNILFFYPEKFPSVNSSNSSIKKMLLDLRNSSAVIESQLTLKTILKDVNISCCYQGIRRGNGTLYVDFSFQLSKECHEITKYKTVIRKEDAIYVKCESDNEKGLLSKTYENVHLLVQDKRKKDSKVKLKSEPLSKRKDKLSVIIFGTDSVSRLNFHRTQPKTYKYMRKVLKAIEYKGYNKIGENTFPNAIALLTGNLWDDDFAQKCYKIFEDNATELQFPFDNCPFIWKDFKRFGYITALMEDSQVMATFHFNQAGFKMQPTDHYIRPGFLAAENFGLTKDECFGTKFSHEVLQSYSHDLEVTYLNDLTFSHIWSTGITHYNLNPGVEMDELNLKYLKSLKEDGILNKTILLFISDHGIRFGDFRLTDLGKHETNLPHLFFVVPEWFRKSFPIASKNLQENSLKFSTPLDVYQTLQDILDEKYIDINYLLKNPRECNKRISLFQRLPVTRTCTDIGMLPQFCACQSNVELNDAGGMFKKIEYYLSSFLNNKMSHFPECSKIKSLEVQKAFKSLEEATYQDTVVNLLTVQALYNPGNALIEATLIWDQENKNNSFTVSGEISRVNEYGNQSKCVHNNTEMVKICVCKDMI
ncbi:UNVERIFIED_CONTAM: hypothetical protein RMT77_013618 [Armadillidium vulgare]